MNAMRNKLHRRSTVVANYLFLLIMNVCFYFVWVFEDMTHWVDVVGLGALSLVVITFFQVHWSTGFWMLTHSRADSLDERQLQITYQALSQAFVWFTVICLGIMMTHAVVYRLVPGLDFALSVPLVGSLLYLSQTLPGSILAWTEAEVPGRAV